MIGWACEAAGSEGRLKRSCRAEWGCLNLTAEPLISSGENGDIAQFLGSSPPSLTRRAIGCHTTIIVKEIPNVTSIINSPAARTTVFLTANRRRRIKQTPTSIFVNKCKVIFEDIIGEVKDVDKILQLIKSWSSLAYKYHCPYSTCSVNVTTLIHPHFDNNVQYFLCQSHSSPREPPFFRISSGEETDPCPPCLRLLSTRSNQMQQSTTLSQLSPS